MNKIFALVLASLLLSLFSLAADTTFIINGKLDKVKSGKIYLSIYAGGVPLKDSARILNGQFSFKGTIKDPVQAILTMETKQGDYFLFYLEPLKINISGTGDSLKLLTVKGSPVNDDNKILKQRLEYVNKWQESANALYSEAMKAKNKELTDSLDDVSDNILKEKRKVVGAFVKDYPNSKISAIAIADNFAYYAEADEVEPLYNLLGTEIKNSNKGKAIKKMVDVYKKVAIGKVPPDFSQATPDGKMLSLSSLKGKYVLVDFWASWCGPCRRENPNVVKTYQKYKDKNFEILGVSYDTKKPNWEGAIKADSLTWHQVSDLLGWKNATAELYGIKAIPANLLLDKDGKIIAKNIFGRKLYAKLDEVLNRN